MKKPMFCLLLVMIASLPLEAQSGEVALDELQTQIQALMTRISPSELGGYETDRIKATVLDKYQTAAKAAPSHGTAVTGARLLLQQGSEDVAYLKTLTSSRSLPDPYRDSLSRSSDLLGNLASSGRMTNADLSRLTAVVADLRTKAEHAQLINVAAFKLIDVTVHTRKQDKEAGGYEVWSAPAAFGDGSRDRRFDRYSSPTSQPLAPGNYYLWARSTEDGKTGPRQVFAIGKGKTAHEIDIAAP